MSIIKYVLLFVTLDIVFCLNRPTLYGISSRHHCHAFHKVELPRLPVSPLLATPNMDNPMGESDEDESDELNALFDQIKDMNPEDVPEDISNAINERITKDAPADWKIRLRLMGFNPITIAGYALAAVILTCNTVFGTGWAGDLLGMNEVIVEDRTVTIQPRVGANGKFNNNFDGLQRSEVQTIELNSKDNLL
mmetsp:Transcript_31075/g.29664  ORF Transcript_31075/g.29664 Transcript_31075/m.29664 type:complete len:193 (-) Transcript_31075:120-698(-)|eukprot:CAMPEP_0119045822 /NCGR_PEP_ID=MMETSP1177-20130426/42762_1 /TAXON_ID=2985 /ORGANISM="Ochromonas sp, Strain CCMP1899" /LENGTH=192 /DNA_ID=CAMNT_0007018197 /DNA_START=78 /DNA_END=656 /DNA_ORIENTATION=+